jgi:hypothetical protein
MAFTPCFHRLTKYAAPYAHPLPCANGHDFSDITDEIRGNVNLRRAAAADVHGRRRSVLAPDRSPSRARTLVPPEVARCGDARTARRSRSTYAAVARSTLAGRNRGRIPGDDPALAMRNHLDRRQKGLLRAIISLEGSAEREREVTHDPQRVDVWFEPRPEAVGALAPLGLLAELTRTHCAFEVYGRTPTRREVRACLRKALALQHAHTRGRTGARAGPPPPMWIVCAGKPHIALERMDFVPVSRRPGMYRLGEEFRVALLALPELPRTRETLALRLLGVKDTLKDALTDLRALDAGDPVKELLTLTVLGWLSRHKGGRGTFEQEVEESMYKSVAEEYRDKLRSEGLREGIVQGIVQGRVDGIMQGRVEGGSHVARRVCERRLGRALREDEARTLVTRLAEAGEDAVADAVVSLSPAELAQWLEARRDG